MPRAARPPKRDDATRIGEFVVELLRQHGKLSGTKIRQLLVADGGVASADADAALVVAKRALDAHRQVELQARSYVWVEPAAPPQPTDALATAPTAAPDDSARRGGPRASPNNPSAAPDRSPASSRDSVTLSADPSAAPDESGDPCASVGEHGDAEEALRLLLRGGRLAAAKRRELAEPIRAALRGGESKPATSGVELERMRAELAQSRAELEQLRAALAAATAQLDHDGQGGAAVADAQGSRRSAEQSDRGSTEQGDSRSLELRQAQERQLKIDAVRALAELAMEVEELTANEVEAQVLVHRVRARVRKEGLEPIDRAGEETTFDRKRHKPIVGGISDGEPVSVVRPGYTWRAPGEDVLIGKAIVEE